MMKENKRKKYKRNNLCALYTNGKMVNGRIPADFGYLQNENEIMFGKLGKKCSFRVCDGGFKGTPQSLTESETESVSLTRKQNKFLSYTQRLD